MKPILGYESLRLCIQNKFLTWFSQREKGKGKREEGGRGGPGGGDSRGCPWGSGNFFSLMCVPCNRSGAPNFDFGKLKKEQQKKLLHLNFFFHHEFF